MAGRPQADQARVLAAGREAEGAVERGHADDIDQRDPQLGRDQTEGFRRKISVCGLDIQKDGDQVLSSALVLLDDGLDFLFLDDQDRSSVIAGY